MSQQLEFETAGALLVERAEPVSAEYLPLEQCPGRVLAGPVTARRDVPHFARSPYDGYAFCSADTARASQKTPVTLILTEEIPAGAEAKIPVSQGRAAKVLTGAMLPEGADAVSKFEETEFTDRTVTLFRPYRAGENVVRPGEDVRRGVQLAGRGAVLDPALLGTLAGQGFETLEVYRLPRVGLITIGSELLPPGQAPYGGRIVDTNRSTFQAAIQNAGAECCLFRSPGDDAGDIAACLDQALTACDLVLTTGGVSVGDYDRTPAAALRAGAEHLASDLNLKPGGKSWFGVRKNKLLCCLSGNPASALTAFYALVLPVLRRLRGCARPYVHWAWAEPETPLCTPSAQTRLLRGQLLYGENGLLFRAGSRQGNGMLSAMAGCGALAVIPAGTAETEPVTRVQLLLLN